MKIKRIALLGAAAASALALAACQSGGEEAEQPVNATDIDNLTVPADEMSNVMLEAPVTDAVENAATPTPAPMAELTADEQTQADAEATGMTSRVSREEPGNATVQPVR